MKPAKPLWRVTIATTREAEDAVAEMLGALLSRTAVSYHNLETGVTTVTVYCADKPAADVRKTITARLARIKRCGLKIGSGKITIAKVRREDWAESWKRHFKPIEIGDALLVKSSWCKRRPRKDQTVVVLDPGLSFGTGQHPTTAFCLHEIVRRKLWRRSAGGPPASSKPDITPTSRPRFNLFWTSAQAPAFWRLRRQNSAISRFTHLTLMQMRSRLPV